MIEKLDTSRASFRNSYKKLDEQIKGFVKNALVDLVKNPTPSKYRLEKLRGYKNPGIYTIHVTKNHSHKLSFEIIDNVAVLRKVATHKEIDREP